MVQGGGNDGRDHHPNAFTMWLAGGGIKPGITLGASDDFGFNAVKDKRPRPRPARHDPAPARLRPHQADVPLPGPRLPADRRHGKVVKDCWPEDDSPSTRQGLRLRIADTGL